MSVLETPSCRVVLPAPLVRQERSGWCWAACLQMGFRLFERAAPISQCELASQAFARSDGCDNPSCSDCNRGIELARISEEWRRYGYDADTHEGAVPFADLTAALDRGRPVEASLVFPGRSHLVMVVGYGRGGLSKRVLVHDPERGARWVTFDDLRYGYGEGFWNRSWTISAR